MTQAQYNNLAAAARAAVTVEKATGCPAALLVAQWAVESDWGRSAPGNNFLGYKSYPGAFGRQLLKTWEWFTDADLAKFLALGDGRTAELKHPKEDTRGRKFYIVRDWFATFPSLEACFKRRAQRFNAGRHLEFVKAYFANGNVVDLFSGVARTGYATADPDGYAEAMWAAYSRPETQAALEAAKNELEKVIA